MFLKEKIPVLFIKSNVPNEQEKWFKIEQVDGDSHWFGSFDEAKVFFDGQGLKALTLRAMQELRKAMR